MTQTYFEKVRIYPNQHQEELLLKYLDINRGIYNAIIYKQRKALQAYAVLCNTGIFDEDALFPLEKEETKALKPKRHANTRMASCHYEFQASIIKRAFTASKRRKKGQKLRFKNPNTFKTIVMSHADRAVRFSPNGTKVKFFNDVGFLKLKHGRKVPQNFTTISIHFKNDKWYIIFNCKREAEILPPTLNIIGIDLGITNIIADSNGVLVQNPRYIERQQTKLKKLQQIFAEGQYKDYRLKRAIARLQMKVLNQSRDFQHKLARSLVNTNDTLLIEKLQVKEMKENGNKNQRKGLQNVALGRLVQYLCDKAESAGRRVVFVNPAYTSQDCSSCGFRDARNRKGEQFLCLQCGFKEHADINAARNILKKGSVGAYKSLVPVAETGLQHTMY